MSDACWKRRARSFQATQNDPFERIWKSRRQFVWRARVILQHRRECLRQGFPSERPSSRGHLVQHGAEAEDVTSGVQFPSRRLLRRHVGRRTCGDFWSPSGIVTVRGPLIALAVCDEPREAEVQYLDLALKRDDDVRRLEIAVDDAVLVRRRESVRNRDRHAQHLVDCHPIPGDERVQRRALVGTPSP